MEMGEIAVDIGTTFGSPWGTGKGLADLVSLILSNAVAFAGIVMLFLMLGGGIAIIVGAGQNNPEASAKGKQAVTSAIIGFIIIFTAYWIIQIIELISGLDILKPVI